jgi:hypothetical protein
MRVDRLATELLVFILPDSLELAPTLRHGASVQQSDVRSERLRTTLESINTRSIARAFPDWQEMDSIAYNCIGQRVRRPNFHRVFTLTFASEREADEAIKKLSELPAVLYVEKHSRPILNSDPYYLDGRQWHLRNDGRNGGIVGADIGAEWAWSIFTGSPDIIIGIFDSGVETDHEEFAGKATGNHPVGSGPYHGHGTQVAGMAAAWGNNQKGGRGLDWNAQIRSYRIFQSCGDYLKDNVAANAIVNAVDQGVHVLNHSWSFSLLSTVMRQAFAYAYKMNRISVSTMGRVGQTDFAFPGALHTVIAVGSTTNRDIRSGFSPMGNHIDVVAPGENVFTTNVGGYTTTRGTSFSAPLVSGLASLLKGYRPELFNDDIQQIIRLSADKVPAMNGADFTTAYGYGRINAGRALEMVRDGNISHLTTIGGTVYGTPVFYQAQLMGNPNLPSAPMFRYMVQRHEVRKTVNFPIVFSRIRAAWGRGVGTTGWSMANPNYGEGFCEVVSFSPNHVTLKTYVYQVWDITMTNFLGWYPAAPNNVVFAYTILLSSPSNVPPSSITGPDIIYDISEFSLSNQGLLANWSVTQGFTIISDSVNVNKITVRATTPGQHGTIKARTNSGEFITMKYIRANSVLIFGPDTICGIESFSLSNNLPTNWTSITPTSSFMLVQPSVNVTSVAIRPIGLNGQAGELRASGNGGVLVARKLIHVCNAFITGPTTICDVGNYALNNPNLRADWSIPSTSGFTITSQATNINSVTVVPTSLNGQTGTLTATINGVAVTKNIQACGIIGPDVICSWGIYEIPSNSPWSVIEWHIDPPGAFKLIDAYDFIFSENSVLVTIVDPTVQSATLTAVLDNGLTLAKLIELCPTPAYLAGPDTIRINGDVYWMMGITDGWVEAVWGYVLKDGVWNNDFQISWHGSHPIMIVPNSPAALVGGPITVVVWAWVKTWNGEYKEYYFAKTIQLQGSIIGPSTICNQGVFSINVPGSRANWSVPPGSGFSITSPTTNVNSVQVWANGINGQSTTLTAVVNGGGTLTKTIQACNTSIVGPNQICNFGTYSLANATPNTFTVTPPHAFKILKQWVQLNCTTFVWDNTIMLLATGEEQIATLTATTATGESFSRDIQVCTTMGMIYIDGDDLLCADENLFYSTNPFYYIVGAEHQPLGIGYVITKGGYPTHDFWPNYDHHTGTLQFEFIPGTLDGEPITLVLWLLVQTSSGGYQLQYVWKTINTCSNLSHFSTSRGLNYIVYPNPTSTTLNVLSLERSNFANQGNMQILTQAQRAEMAAKYEALISNPQVSELLLKQQAMGFKLLYPTPPTLSLDEELRLGNTTNMQGINTAARYEVMLLNPRTAQQIFRRPVPHFDRSFEVDVSSLTNGLYTLLVIRDGEIVHTETIRVER